MELTLFLIFLVFSVIEGGPSNQREYLAYVKYSRNRRPVNRGEKNVKEIVEVFNSDCPPPFYGRPTLCVPQRLYEEQPNSTEPSGTSAPPASTTINVKTTTMSVTTMKPLPTPSPASIQISRPTVKEFPTNPYNNVNPDYSSNIWTPSITATKYPPTKPEVSIEIFEVTPSPSTSTTEDYVYDYDDTTTSTSTSMNLVEPELPTTTESKSSWWEFSQPTTTTTTEEPEITTQVITEETTTEEIDVTTTSDDLEEDEDYYDADEEEDGEDDEFKRLTRRKVETVKRVNNKIIAVDELPNN